MDEEKQSDDREGNMFDRVVRQITCRITELEDNLLQLLKPAVNHPTNESSHINPDFRGNKSNGGPRIEDFHPNKTGLALLQGHGDTREILPEILDMFKDIKADLNQQKLELMKEIANLKESGPYTEKTMLVSPSQNEIFREDILRAKEALRHVPRSSLPSADNSQTDLGMSSNNSLPDATPKKVGKRRRPRRRSTKKS